MVIEINSIDVKRKRCTIFFIIIQYVAIKTCHKDKTKAWPRKIIFL